MSWKLALLLAAVLPARPLQELAAERLGPVAGFAAAATAEEAVFRGVVPEALRGAGSPLPIVFASTTLFAIYHLSAHQLLSTWLYGVVLAGVAL